MVCRGSHRILISLVVFGFRNHASAEHWNTTQCFPDNTDFSFFNLWSDAVFSIPTSDTKPRGAGIVVTSRHSLFAPLCWLEDQEARYTGGWLQLMHAWALCDRQKIHLDGDSDWGP